MLGDLPDSLKIIIYFENNEKASKDEIIDSFEHLENVERALTSLVIKGVLSKEGDIYKQGPFFRRSLRKMQEVYMLVAKLDGEQKTKELIMRGLLIEAFFPPRYILDKLRKTCLGMLPLNLVYKVLPFEENEVEEFLIREERRKLVEITKILSRNVPPSQIYFRFPRLLYIYIKDLRGLSPEEIKRIKDAWRANGLSVYEEEFVSGLYTRDLIDEARNCLSSRKDLTNRIREKLYVELYRLIQPVF